MEQVQYRENTYRPQCGAIKRSGQRCPRFAIPDRTVCAVHAGEDQHGR